MVLANANPALLDCWHSKQTDMSDPMKTYLDFQKTQTASLIAYGKKSGKERSIYGQTCETIHTRKNKLCFHIECMDGIYNSRSDVRVTVDSSLKLLAQCATFSANVIQIEATENEAEIYFAAM